LQFLLTNVNREPQTVNSFAEMTSSSRKVLIASDHAGFELKEVLEAELKSLGYEVDDLGPASDASIDYADYAHPLAKRVSSGEAERGVLLCGTGLGMSYAANRYPHVRAAVAWTPEIAALAREHNDANVLVLPARFVGTEEGKAILKAWLDTPFAGGRHARRIAKIERDAATDTSTEEKP
jgi:ribose 5-phosphate isomerase B